MADRQHRIDAIRHIVYEYGNLMAAGHYSVHGQPPWRTNCDDAFLLGCRKLGDFLHDEGTGDDVLSRDYLSPNLVQRWDLPIWKKEWRRVMNKHLAHITYARVSYSGQEWNHQIWVPKLLREFNSAWWDFREAVSDPDYRVEFDQQVEACQTKDGFTREDGSININLARY